MTHYSGVGHVLGVLISLAGPVVLPHFIFLVAAWVSSYATGHSSKTF